MEWGPIILTIKLALVSTVFLLIIGMPMGWWLSRSNSVLSKIVSVFVSLPLVLPPTVLGFYLLITLGSSGPLGKLTQSLGLGSLAFSFSGLVIGSIIYSLPFVVNPIRNSFESINKGYFHVAESLGANSIQQFFNVALPLARGGIVTSAILGFAHTIGEFGVVLMIGGNIPDKTRVLSIAIYDQVEALDYSKAHLHSLLLLIFSFLILALIQMRSKKLGVIR